MSINRTAEGAPTRSQPVAETHFSYPGDRSPAIMYRGGNIVTFNDWGFVSPTEGWSLNILAGMVTDGASVPRIFFPLISAWDLSFSAPIAHDHLYRVAGQPRGVFPLTKTFSRAETDRIFRLLQEDEGVWWWRRWLSWLAVRGFGFFA